MAQFHEGVIGIIQHELEISEELIFIGGHDVGEERVATFVIIVRERILFQ